MQIPLSLLLDNEKILTMPLFGRKLVDFNRNEYVDNPEENFFIHQTGEYIHNRILYDKLLKAYQLERWTCQCTWRAGLTHEEACLSEDDIRKTLDQLVPSYFHQTIFETIYHSKKTQNDFLRIETCSLMHRCETVGKISGRSIDHSRVGELI